MKKDKIKNSFVILGNNQDGCLLTGDNIDVRDFLAIYDADLNTLAEKNRTSFRIQTGMNMCAAYLKEMSSNLLLWGRLGENYSRFIKLDFPDNIKKCVIGDSHILFLLNNGEVYSAGDGPHGQLGCGDQIKIQLDNPYKLNFNNTKIRNIYTGIRTSFFIDGILYLHII